MVLLFVSQFNFVLRCVLLQERAGRANYWEKPGGQLALKYKLVGQHKYKIQTQTQIQTQIQNTVVNYLVIQDNEFELVFVLGYQKMLALAYLDKVKKCNLNSDFFIFGQKSHNNHFSCWTRFSLDFETCSWTP